MRVKRFLLTVAALWAVDATGAAAPPRLQQPSDPAGAHTDDRGGRAADLPGFQKRIQTTVEKTLPTVVSFIGAAGVIISPEGLVLSQAHVTHPEGAKPGARIRVFLHDGTATEAELLGADRLHDTSLLQLTKPGPYPFAPLADRHPAPGDLVLKMGYPLPLSYRKHRPPEVRLGTVLAATSDAFLTDCRINGGDSGGPYFDLDGRVIGILKVFVPLLDEPAQEGKAVFQHNLVMPRGGLWWRGTPSTLIRARLARMEAGEILTTPEPAQGRAPAKGPVLLKRLARGRPPHPGEGDARTIPKGRNERPPECRGDPRWGHDHRVRDRGRPRRPGPHESERGAGRSAMPPARRPGRSDRGRRHRPGLRPGPAPVARLGARAGDLGESREPAGGHPVSGGRRRGAARGHRHREHPPPGHAGPASVVAFAIQPAARRCAHADRPHRARRRLPGQVIRRERGGRGHPRRGRHPDDRRVASAGQQPDHGLHRPE